MWQPSILILTVVLTQIYAAPQFVTFKEGKLGVNFGGYHAAVGLGGLLGGNSGAEGGLFAEAGTPYGQAARAGLGGSVAGNGGGPSGGLYAGATAGGNVKAAAGLGGEITGDRSSGGGFASASSGGHYASSGLVGGTEIRKPTKEFEATYNKAYTDVKLDAINEIVPAVKSDIEAKFEVKAEAQPTVVVKEVYVEPPPPRVIEKTIIRTHKPHRHHLKKTVYIGGAIGGAIGAGADAAVAPPNLKTIQPIERRSDVGIEDEVYAGVGANVNVNANHGTTGEVSYAKKVTIQRNPTFFQDIFNIPIATLKAVNSFLTNTASGTSISVQKSASVQAESDLASPKHDPITKSVASSSEAHVSVQTPSATKFIDDIFSIPINTLSAVNTFLENNAARKQVQINAETSDEPTRVRLGPHGRRRANKKVVIVQEPAKPESAPQTLQ